MSNQETKQKIQDVLSSSHYEDMKFKIIFKEHDERLPMIGIFVRMKDCDELLEKGMVRFVNQSKLDYWFEGRKEVGLTKIYVIKDFSQLIKM